MLMMLLYSVVDGCCIDHAALTAANGALDTAVGQVSITITYFILVVSYLLFSMLHEI